MMTFMTRLGLVTGLLLGGSVHAHTAGEHGGNLIQQLMHIVQSTDHLFILLAMGFVVSLLVRQYRQARKVVSGRDKTTCKRK